MMTADVPKLFSSAADEGKYKAISSQMENIKLAAFYVPLFLSLLYSFPTYMVWMMSNLLQIVEIISYLRI